LAFLVGVDFDRWSDVHLLGHSGFIVAASGSNTATSIGRVWGEMKRPCDLTHAVIGASPTRAQNHWVSNTHPTTKNNAN
jgi:hypothetical protein